MTPGRLGAFLAFAFLVRIPEPAAQPLEFVPTRQKGPPVMVISGASGTQRYQDFAASLATHGFYVTLFDGNALWALGKDDGELKAAIRRTRESRHALGPKVAVVGLSLGGAACLLYATRLPADVATCIAFYPATNRLGDFDAVASTATVPTLVLAGAADDYFGCCTIENARKLREAMQGAAARAPFDLVEYADAPHGFNLAVAYHGLAARDSLRRTVSHLREHLPLPEGH